MEHLIELLRRKRMLLLKAYVFHVGWPASTCAFAATDSMQVGLTTSLWLTLVTVPPVLLYTVSVHKACRAIDPRAKTAGWIPIILFTLFLTPFESGLILPAKNLLVSRRILRKWDKALAAKTPTRPAVDHMTRTQSQP
jgi:hypothetical protein